MNRVAKAVSAYAGGAGQYGFWKGRALHSSAEPLALGVFGSVVLVTGVVYLHGPIAKVFIGVGAIALLVSTIWNARLVGRCAAPVVLARASGA